MDPFTGLSLAGNILQFVDYAGTILSRAHAIHKSKSLEPEEFIDTEAICKDLLQTLSHLHDIPDAQSPSSLENLQLRCFEAGKDLLHVLDGIRIKGGVTRWKSLKQAISVEWKSGKLEKIQARLLMIRDEIQFHSNTSLRSSIKSLAETQLQGFSDLRMRIENQTALFAIGQQQFSLASSLGNLDKLVPDQHTMLKTILMGQEDLRRSYRADALEIRLKIDSLEQSLERVYRHRLLGSSDPQPRDPASGLEVSSRGIAASSQVSSMRGTGSDTIESDGARKGHQAQNLPGPGALLPPAGFRSAQPEVVSETVVRLQYLQYREPVREIPSDDDTEPCSDVASLGSPVDSPRLAPDHAVNTMLFDFHIGDSDGESSISLSSSTRKLTWEWGRSYATNGSTDYMLPNDEPSQDLEDQLHHLIVKLLNGKLLLRVQPRPQDRVLDVGTGVRHMGNRSADHDFLPVGDAFPDAEIVGMDLSPIQPKWVPPNVRFVIDDFVELYQMQFARPDYECNMIHCRNLVMAMYDWDKFLAWVARELQPGGYVEFQEIHWKTYRVSEDDTLSPDTGPLSTYIQTLSEAFGKLGIFLDAQISLKDRMEHSGWTDVEQAEFVLPLGKWPRDRKLKTIGAWMTTWLVDSADMLANRALRRGVGYTPEEAAAWVGRFREAARASFGLAEHVCFRFVVVSGRKPAV